MRHIKVFESKRDRDIKRDNLINFISDGDIDKFKNYYYKYFYKDKSYGNLYCINFTNDNGWTPFIIAIHKNREEIVKELLRVGADVNYQDKSGGRTALITAAIRDNFDIIKLLIDAGADWNKYDLSDDFDFFDYLSAESKNIIIEKYPEKYKDYIMKKDAKKYNL